jgi:ribosomal protein L30
LAKTKDQGDIKRSGLTKLHKTVYLNNTAPIRGMIEKVLYMVKVEI